jgi:hypothetical protein
MNKFTFINELDSSKRTLEFSEDYLPDILTYFEEFLKGCGFNFDGHLEFVNDEDEINIEGTENSEISIISITGDMIHSDHYYDYSRNKPVQSHEC